MGENYSRKTTTVYFFVGAPLSGFSNKICVVCCILMKMRQGL